MCRFKLIKCKSCRNILFNEEECALFHFNAHKDSYYQGDCMTILFETFIFLDETHSSQLSQWMKDALDTKKWQNGKLRCPSCNGHFGGFDFVHGSKCGCEEHLLPPINIIKSKVDHVRVEVPKVNEDPEALLKRIQSYTRSEK